MVEFVAHAIGVPTVHQDRQVVMEVTEDTVNMVNQVNVAIQGHHRNRMAIMFKNNVLAKLLPVIRVQWEQKVQMGQREMLEHMVQMEPLVNKVRKAQQEKTAKLVNPVRKVKTVIQAGRLLEQAQQELQAVQAELDLQVRQDNRAQPVEMLNQVGRVLQVMSVQQVPMEDRVLQGQMETKGNKATLAFALIVHQHVWLQVINREIQRKKIQKTVSFSVIYLCRLSLCVIKIL